MEYNRVEEIRNELHKAVNKSIEDVYSIVHSEIIRMAISNTHLIVSSNGVKQKISVIVEPVND